MSDGSARISRADVEHTARLARLALTDTEIEQLTEELGKILDHAARVSALDTTDVPPTSHPIELVNVLRPDEVRPSLDSVEVLAEAPVAEDGRFRVPRIMSEEA
ncbi:MAG TPA: Asp-tRNA(Asn)/Glu-tRNA(Gln) amidotransferase subunit GatC [Acidimicrobiia bacterium]|jgi:aspartyl-tRNA(Asn)/glutamyl-tRNA(Gln) amidotransferase subunit C|nr:Asp-tRNA(Asn)/Glu-tRNA(Gln) amidotransferase subunit GatC [Acidimicrobiia bacterium]